MGKPLNAYRRSGALGKIGFWGSVASLVSLFIMFVPQNSGSQTAPEPQLHQDGQGGHNQAIVIQGNDNKINLPDGKDEVAELIEILELRRKEVNHTIDANIINLPKSDAEFMLQFQRRFNNLIDDLVKAETHHQFILAHEITIKIHQLGFELTQTKNRIYELVGKEMSTKKRNDIA